MIKYLKGDATRPQAEGPKIVAHICNDKGGWGKGFVLAVSKRWPEPEAYYRRWYHSKHEFALGRIQLVQVEDNLWVANMVAQRGYRVLDSGIPLQYNALDECLAELDYEATLKAASIHMPRIGCGLAGGSWERVEPLIQKNLGYKDVFVYDY